MLDALIIVSIAGTIGIAVGLALCLFLRTRKSDRKPRDEQHECVKHDGPSYGLWRVK